MAGGRTRLHRERKHHRSRPIAIAAAAFAALILLLGLARPIRAQQRPTLTLESFNYTTSHRQNVCSLQQRIDDGSLRLRTALKGLNLTTWLLADGRFFNLDPDGRIDGTDPGFIGVLLDELADRAGFRWRESFGIVNSVLIPEDKTYNDLLTWSIWSYDLSAAYWQRSLERMALGASFPEGWLDARLIMVGKRDGDAAGSSSLNLWSFLEPFSWQVWIMIIVTVVISGLVYWFLDWWDNDSDDQDLDSDPANNLFLAAISFTGHFEFKPRSNTARLFTVSLAFWSLIMMSAYTANLASFLVVRNTPSADIDTVGDAVRSNYRICVVGKGNQDSLLTKSYAGARILRVQTEEELFEHVGDGACDISLTTVSSWDEFKRNRMYNGNCDLAWIGRAFTDGEGGFATKSDSGSKCTSLVRDVMNLHLLEMKAEGFISTAWEGHYSKLASIDCDADVAAAADDDESGQLSLQALGGTFLIHYILTALAVFLSIAWKCHKDKSYTCRRNAASNTTAAQSVSNGEHGSKSIVRGPDGFSNEAGLRSSVNRHYEEIYEKQNEKLTEMLAMIEAMKSESSAMRNLVHSTDKGS